MNMKLGWMALSIAVICWSCGAPQDENDKTAPQSKESRQQEIAQMETELRGRTDLSVHVNKAKADVLVKRYRDYVNMNPRDSISAEYLFKAADLSIGMGNYEASIAFLDRITQDHAQYHKIVEIWLFKGFVYENYLNSHAKAVETYQTLIEKYPNHRLAQDAKAAVENLSLSEEELMEKFKKMNEKPES